MADGSRGWTREAWDRVVASDPGLTRLRMAVSAATAMATAMALEFGFAELTHAGPQGVLVSILLGTMMAMMGSMALAGAEVWPKVRTAVFFPVAIGVGMLAGVAVSGHTDLMLCVFVLVMFAAVFVRRFGLPFFFYGFMLWMGYFFAAFLGATLSAVPAMLEAVCVGTAWVLLLSCTVLRTNTRRTLRRTRRAYGARARAVARACADLLEAGVTDPRRATRLRRTLHARQLRLAEAALIIDGWSAEPRALSPGAGPLLRRRVLDSHLVIDAMAGAAEALAAEGGPLLAGAARTVAAVARRDDATAEALARALLDAPATGATSGTAERETGTAGDGYWPAHHLAAAVVEFTTLATAPPLTTDPLTAASPTTDPPAGRTTAPETRPATETPDEGDAFAPTVALIAGLLPGSGAVAGDVHARGHGWNWFSRRSLITRQAIQVVVAGGLAIVAGRQLSEVRYYWAVLAAFIAFAGTATRSETTIKALNRVAGTLVGLGAAVLLAHLTAGHVYWVLATVILSMSLGFYLVNVSYASMIFFVTIMVAQMYSVLGTFTAGLLVLRLEETALGAAIGIAVALVVLPTSTRDTVGTARQRYLTAFADVLRACAGRLTPAGAPVPVVAGPGAVAEEAGSGGQEQVTDAGLDALVRTLDHRLQQLTLVARPLTRPLVWGNSPRVTRHRLTLFTSATRHVRALALAPRRAPEAAHDDTLAVAAASFGAAATLLAEAPVPAGAPGAEVAALLATADTALYAHRPRCAPSQLPPVSGPLLHLGGLLHELATAPGIPVVPPVPAPPAGQEADGPLCVGGLVLTAGGGPVPDAVVALTDENGRQAGRGSTGEDGRFALGVPGPGTYLLIGTAGGHAPQAVTVVVRHRGAEVCLELAGRGAVSGTVTGASGTPVAGAAVRAVPEGGGRPRGTVTAADGGYRLDGLPDGRYTLTVTAGGRIGSARPVRVPRPADGAETVPVRCDVRLAPGAEVGGVVRGSSGAPVPEARVTLVDGSGVMVGTATTDGEGRFSLADIPAQAGPVD